jgi:hypothetical protein
LAFVLVFPTLIFAFVLLVSVFTCGNANPLRFQSHSMIIFMLLLWFVIEFLFLDNPHESVRVLLPVKEKHGSYSLGIGIGGEYDRAKPTPADPHKNAKQQGIDHSVFPLRVL